jgi:hypothetical protein
MVFYTILNSSPTGTGTCAWELYPSYCSVISDEIYGLSRYESYIHVCQIFQHTNYKGVILFQFTNRFSDIVYTCISCTVINISERN